MGSEVQILSGAMLLKVFTTGPVATHAYLIGCPQTKEAAIIDAPQDVTPLILKVVAEQGLTVTKILLTHSHWDHIADTAALKKAFKAPLYVHENDKKNVQHPGSDKLHLMFPIEAAEPDHFLKEGDVVHVGNLEIHVIETPGHTPGGICLFLPKEGVLFSGDTLFRKGIGRLDLPTSAASEMPASLKKLAGLPPATTVYPGHGPPTTIGDEYGQLNWEN